MPVSFDQYKALLWVRQHQPTDWSETDAPPRRIRVSLMQAGLIRFSAARRRFDPISFTLSEQGEKALASDEQRA
jgi:hypothetical protein